MTSVGDKQSSNFDFGTVAVAQSRFRSPCPVARALDVLGDKWTLVVMRDALFFGARTYADFASQWERIPSNLLA